MVLIDFKGYFQGQKGSNLDFCYLFRPISQKGACCDQCLYEAHIKKVIYDLSVDLVIFDLGLPFKDQIKVTDLSRGCVP